MFIPQIPLEINNIMLCPFTAKIMLVSFITHCPLQTQTFNYHPETTKSCSNPKPLILRITSTKDTSSATQLMSCGFLIFNNHLPRDSELVSDENILFLALSR